MSYHNHTFVGIEILSLHEGVLDLGTFLDAGPVPLFLVSHQGRIDLYDEEGFFEASGNLQSPLDPSDDAAVQYRDFFAGAEVAEAGPGGRLQVNPEVWRRSGLEENVVVIGTGNVVSIWHPADLKLVIEGPIAEHSVEAMWRDAVSELRSNGDWPY